MAVNIQRTIMRAIGAKEQQVTVTSVEDVTPTYRRVHFSAPEFISNIELFPTIWIRLWVPSPENPAQLKQRGYTLVNPNKEHGTFALEFVMHEISGAATHWAQHAQPGDTVEIAFTPARIHPDPNISRFALLGDYSAIAGINSLINYLPANSNIDVVLIDTHATAPRTTAPHTPTEHALVTQAPNVTLTVVPDSAAQIQTLRALELDLEDCYVWAAGERQAVAAVRAIVRKEWGLSKDRQHTQYYWIAGKPFG